MSSYKQEAQLMMIWSRWWWWRLCWPTLHQTYSTIYKWEQKSAL